MERITEQSKILLISTKTAWKDRNALIAEMSKHIQDTKDPLMVTFLEQNYTLIACQFNDLR